MYEVNTQYLENKIRESGLKMKFIAESLGINLHSLRNKITNKTHFRSAEVFCLCYLLGITKEEKEAIFFAIKVDK